MKNIILLILTILVSFNSYSSIQQTDSLLEVKIPQLEEILDRAEGAASPDGRAILVKARSMIKNGDIVKGSCWDFINALFDRAGYPSKNRPTIFKSPHAGPYADDVMIEEGDWLYFINHSYNNVEHSGVFVAWSDFAAKEAVMISYAGGNQAKPARYKIYDLSSVYNIMRPTRK